MISKETNINRIFFLMAIWTACVCSCTKKNLSQTTPPADVAEFTVNQDKIVSTDFVGFGTEYNQNVYSAFSATDGINASNIGQLEAKVKALKSQYVRIFFDSKAWPTDSKYSPATADFMASFVNTVKLAQDAGATTINITFWHTATVAQMPAFADVLNDLIVNRGLTSVKQVTIQNEVNSTSMTMADYKACYVSLDQALKTLAIRNLVKFVGGDLVQTDQQNWFTYMAANMNDLLYGYSTHIYWDDNDAAKPATRLTEVTNIVKGLGAAAKPLYVTEYGVRGGNKTGAPDPGNLTGTNEPISQTNTSALQNALFQVNGLNLGYGGFIRWDCYKAKYDGGTQYFSCIGSGTDGYPLYPLYYITCLFTNTCQPGWNVVETKQGTNINKAVAVMREKTGQNMTLYAVNKSNGMFPYVVAGLPAKKNFHVIVWNNDQKGKIEKIADVSTDESGMLKLNLPAQAVAAVTTLNVDISKIL
ncbi:MAG: hypothetical protein JWP81_3978 [Ferruginibacter sp.]|nr:hypothetical protein [Ferruginibacter sp.]